MSLKRNLGWLAASALALPLSAGAAPISLDFTGSVSQIINPAPDLPSAIMVGSAFDMTLTFDPAQFSLTNGCALSDGYGACGAVYDTSATHALSFSLDFGWDCDASAPGPQTCLPDMDATTDSQIWLFDDYRVTLPNGQVAPQADLLSFVLFPEGQNGTNRWLFTLSGPTNIFSSITSGVPQSLDAGFGFQELRVCDQISQGESGPAAFTTCALQRPVFSQLVVANTVPVVVTPPPTNVPEPETLAMLGLGLVSLGAIGLWRRRKQQD